VNSGCVRVRSVRGRGGRRGHGRADVAADGRDGRRSASGRRTGHAGQFRGGQKARGGRRAAAADDDDDDDDDDRKRRRRRPQATLSSDRVRDAVRQVRDGQLAGGRVARRTSRYVWGGSYFFSFFVFFSIVGFGVRYSLAADFFT